MPSSKYVYLNIYIKYPTQIFKIHLIYALHQTRNKRSKNDIEKRTKGLNDYVGEAKLKLFTQTDQFTCLADFEIKSIWPKFKVSGQSSKYLAKVQSIWPKFKVSGQSSKYLAKVQSIWPKFKVSGQSSKYLAKVQSIWPKFKVSGQSSKYLAKVQN